MIIVLESTKMSHTCTAPGHPSCTITCPQGCIAIYNEETGVCRTTCGPADAPTGWAGSTRVSIEAYDARSEDIARLFRGSLNAETLALLDTSQKRLSFTHRTTTVDELGKILTKLLTV